MTCSQGLPLACAPGQLVVSVIHEDFLFVCVNNILVCDLIFFHCADRYLNCFFSLALMIEAALHVSVQESVGIYYLSVLGWIPRGKIATLFF